MRVCYTARQVSRSLPVVYQQGPVRFCCESMCRWWGLLVGFGVLGHSASTSRDVCLYLSRPQVNGVQSLEVVPVQHCPWCAEAIEPCREKYATYRRC